MKTLKEWGAISSYQDFLRLPQRVREDVRMVASADGQTRMKERTRGRR